MTRDEGKKNTENCLPFACLSNWRIFGHESAHTQFINNLEKEKLNCFHFCSIQLLFGWCSIDDFLSTHLLLSGIVRKYAKCVVDSTQPPPHHFSLSLLLLLLLYYMWFRHHHHHHHHRHYHYYHHDS